MTITLSGTVSFESRSGTWALELGGKSGTPTVEISVTNRNIIKVTAQFNGSNGSAPGFYFDIVSLNPDVKALTPTTGIAQGNTGWTSWEMAWLQVRKCLLQHFCTIGWCRYR